MAAPISREDYLKRYLSVNAEEKKKKKRKKAHATAKVSRVKIFDDDIDLKSLQPDNLSNTFDDDVGDNEPTVADVIDERPEHIKLLEKYRSSGAWKTFENSEEKHSKKRHDSDSDNSPSRRKRHDSDFDQSPVRRQRHDSDSDQSTSRRQRHDSDSDQSPARRQRHNSDSDQSPARKRHNSDSDQSPARRQRHDSDADQSPARRQRHDSDSDQSPHRKQHSKSKSDRLQRHKNSNPEQRRQDSPQRKKTKTSSRTHYSDSDQSPPRRQGNNSDSDQSPPRRRGNKSDSDQSPPRRRGNKSDSDQSPPRRRGNKSDSDQSPPRRRGNKSDSDQSPPRKHGKKPDSDESPPRKSKLFRSKDLTPDGSRSGKGNKKNEEMTLGGKKAGLSSAKDMRREADELRRKEDQSFRQISDDQLGRGSATVFRDKSGRKRNLAEEREKKSEEAKKKEKDDEKFKQWGKGLKQIEEQSQRLESDLYETTKPLARYKDDEDLDQMLREMDRAEDPMLAFIKKKKNKSAGPAVNEKPRYKGRAPPPNRFGIMPGYRWDGVDRSNGFEKQMFSKIAEKKATATHAYKWSTEDM